MGFSREGSEHLKSVVPVVRFSEDPAVEDDDRVCADDDPVGVIGGNRSCLDRREIDRRFFGGDPFWKGLFDVGDDDLKIIGDVADQLLTPRGF